MFAVFAGEHYYPIGGWNDLKAQFNTLEEAQKYVTKWASKANWYQLVDLTTGIVLDRRD